MFGLPPTIPPAPACELVVLVKRQSGRSDLVEIRGDAQGISQLLDTLASGLANAVIDPSVETEREVGAYRVRVRVSP